MCIPQCVCLKYPDADWIVSVLPLKTLYNMVRGTIGTKAQFLLWNQTYNDMDNNRGGLNLSKSTKIMKSVTCFLSYSESSTSLEFYIQLHAPKANANGHVNPRKIVTPLTGTPPINLHPVTPIGSGTRFKLISYFWLDLTETTDTTS